jgi:4-amino-4-deoxy-L-arabinose transferase-like glycosyltransferase
MKTSAIEVPLQQLRTFINHRYFLLFCIISGVLLRLLWIWLVDAPQVSDFQWYYERALTIASGGGYSVNDVPTAYWPVGYPGFLGIVFAIFGPSLVVAKLVNILLYTTATFWTYLLSKQIFSSESAARLALFILSFSPNQIAYTALLSTEIFFMFLLLSGAVCFVYARRRLGFFLLAGLFWGLATLTKPQALFVPVIFLSFFSADLRSFVKSGLIVLPTLLLVILPWMVRNYFVIGTPSLSTNGGIVLMIGNNPYATGRQIWDSNVQSLLGDLAATEDQMFDGKEVAREERARDIAIHYILHHPIDTALLWPRKILALYASDVDGIYYSLGIINRDSRALKVIYFGLRALAESFYLGVVILFAVSLPAVLRDNNKRLKLGLVIILYFTATYLLFFGNARYHFALMPWIAIYAGIGAMITLNLFKRHVPTTALSCTQRDVGVTGS